MSDDVRARSERGRDCMSTIAGSKETAEVMSDFMESRGALGQIAQWTAAGEIWAREAFSRRDRSMAVIASLTALGREMELRQHVVGGLNHGLTVEEVDEIMVQLAPYIGMPFALAGSVVVDAVVAEREGGETRKAPHAPLAEKSNAERRADGLDVLIGLVGQPGFDGKAIEASILESQRDMGVLVMDYAFGEVWARPQLSRRDRSLVVISALTALNQTHELEIHIGAGLNHGLTAAEVEEIMITMVAYGGFPRAIDGFNLTKKVVEARAAAG